MGKRKRTISFLFGAGAEADLGLLSGAEFKRKTILSEQVRDYFYLINQKNGDYDIEKGAVLDKKSSSVLYQTLVESEKSEELIQEIENLFTGSSEIINNYIENKKANKNVGNEFGDLYKKLYEVLFNEKADQNEYKEIIKELNYYSYVDSLFNYLRHPYKYKHETEKVIKLYFSAHFAILKCIAEKVGYDPISYLDNMSSVLTGRKKLSELLERVEDKIIAKNQGNESLKDIYYNTIKEIKNENSKDIEMKFVTTNYTRLAQKIILTEDKFDTADFAYLHGRMDLFESLDNKEIKCIDEFSDEEIIFPFVLIQSGIKPIINRFQINQMSKGLDIISESDCLVVLGYGLNSDDEHIINAIRERQTQGKITYLFYYENEPKIRELKLSDEFFKVIKVTSDNFRVELNKILNNASHSTS